MRIKAGQNLKKGFESECQSAKEQPCAISSALANARSRIKARSGIERAFR
jgi:hypothetical protein